MGVFKIGCSFGECPYDKSPTIWVLPLIFGELPYVP